MGNTTSEQPFGRGITIGFASKKDLEAAAAILAAGEPENAPMRGTIHIDGEIDEAKRSELLAAGLGTTGCRPPQAQKSCGCDYHKTHPARDVAARSPGPEQPTYDGVNRLPSSVETWEMLFDKADQEEVSNFLESALSAQIMHAWQRGDGSVFLRCNATRKAHIRTRRCSWRRSTPSLGRRE